MKHYKHLTPEQRYQLSALLQTKIPQSQIARIVGVDKSTISREIKRNRGKRGYRHKQAQRQGALLTLVDRTTREIKIKALPNRKADAVTQAGIELLACKKPQSITFDNGKESAQHQSIAEALNTTVYFARPYHSWERGSNENANGLIRQFLPKSVPLDKLTADFVQAVEDSLNNRPRKILGFQTPLEVKSTFGRVAPRC